MSRQKNALVEYSIAPVSELGEAGEYMRLAKYITGVSNSTDENVEDQAFMDGDGTEESDVTSVKMAYEFEGMYLDEDPAMKYIRGIELKTGEDRKLFFQIKRPDGVTYEGKATVTDIVTSGGDASEFEEFSCKIGFDRQPTITPALP